MLRRWGLAGFVMACGLAVSATAFIGGTPWPGAVELVVFAALAALCSPLAFPRTVTAERARAANDGRPVIYWRPGCQYCLRLRFRLGRRARHAYWVDIWRDPAGAAAVRAVTGGDETVPTVILDGRSYVNPDPAWLLSQLRPVQAGR